MRHYFILNLTLAIKLQKEVTVKLNASAAQLVFYDMHKQLIKDIKKELPNLIKAK